MDAFNFIDSWGAIKQRNDLIMLILTFSLFLNIVARATISWMVDLVGRMSAVNVWFAIALIFWASLIHRFHMHRHWTRERELSFQHLYICFCSHSHCYLFRVRISWTLLFSVNVQSRRNEMNLKHELNMKWCVVHWWIRDLCKIMSRMHVVCLCVGFCVWICVDIQMYAFKWLVCITIGAMACSLVKWILDSFFLSLCLLKNQQIPIIWKWPKNEQKHTRPSLASHQIWTKTNYTMLFFVYCLLLCCSLFSLSIHFLSLTIFIAFLFVSVCCFVSILHSHFGMSCQNQ